MSKWILFLVSFLSLSSQAEMVFMRENEEGKHIFIQKNDGTVSQLSSGEAWHLYPDITPDGSWVAWVEGGEKDLGIVLFNRTSQKKEFWKMPFSGRILQPKFSKNGKLLFFSGPTENNKNALYLINLEESRSRHDQNTTIFNVIPQKLDESESAFFPRPSSDGNFVVYHRSLADKREVIYFDRVQNKKMVIAEGMSPSLSFDEKYIAYTVKENGNWNIHVYNRYAQGHMVMTDDAHDEMAPTFKPDNTLVFASNKSGNYKLYELKQGGWTQLVEGTGDDYAPAFTGDIQFKQAELSPFIGNPRSSFGSIVHQGKVYMVGGHQGKEHTYPPESFSDATIVYDPATNSWQDLAPRPHKAHGFQLAAKGKYIYAFGGFAYNANYKPKWHSLDVIDRYDIEKNEWKTIGKMPRKRSSNIAVTIKDKVYLVGGWDSTPKYENDIDGTFLKEIDIFDFTSETIIQASFEMPSPLRRAFTGTNYNGKILLVGGIGEGGSHFSLISRITTIDPETGFVTELPILPFATFAPAAAILGNELFVFAGMYKLNEMEYDYVAHIYALNLASFEWRHTGRYVKETKGFSQVFNLDQKTLGILGGHHYFEGYDSPVTTFETFSLTE